MDEKSLKTLEYEKVLELVAEYCDFSVSEDQARRMRPTSDLESARRRMGEASEAFTVLVEYPETSIGGARDIRQAVDMAKHGGVLTSLELLDIKSTLVSARNLERKFERLRDQFPYLADIASRFPPPLGLVDAITRTVSDRGDILDSASEKLGIIRRDLRIVHERLISKLERLVSSPDVSPLLQEALITQRDGRYVLPLRSEFKGRIKAVVHDQSSSGATLFIEPLTVVDLNNQYRELQLGERDEERRILADLSQMIGRFSDELGDTLRIIAELDLCLARAKYGIEIGGVEPVIHPLNAKTTRKSKAIIRLLQARHPLLDPGSVVPIDIEFSENTFALVITGPNTGGKTVTLKTAGLLALMAQSGLFIPAQPGSEISLFDNIFADIGDEQSIEQSLSTFSGHINNIVNIIAGADQSSLVILDELGAGTDPQEGAALARSLLRYFLGHGITTLVSTHHPELKSFAHATSGVENASMEFDIESLRPTYRLTIGLPGRSNAIAIAKRLGLLEEIIQDSLTEINPKEMQADEMLDEIQRQKELARKARSEAERLRKESEALRRELIERLEGIESERFQILSKAQEEVDQHVGDLKEEIDKLRRTMLPSKEPLEKVEAAAGEVDELEEEYELPYEPVRPKTTVTISRPIQVGDTVSHRKLDTRGFVTGLDEEEAEIQIGVLRIRTKLHELELVDEEDSGSSEISTGQSAGKITRSAGQEVLQESPGVEINLRGKRADEALESLERYLDSAYLYGLPYVRIIHGKGTGKLRQVIRQALSHNPNVKSYEAGRGNEGGEGVTIAKLDL